MMYFLQQSFIFVLTLHYGFSLYCKQCNGWTGHYPPARNTVSTCDNRDNICYTTLFCVKIVDPMRPGLHYATFKSDCYYQVSIQVSPTNLSYITSGRCYPYLEGVNPTQRWWYCFCNDRDYCNGAPTTFTLLGLISTITVAYFVRN
uniref:Protein sleepless n=1 Tax=Panagrellus redivivus TaxID=6233 RepID=A0A7E4ZWH9_PANRE